MSHGARISGLPPVSSGCAMTDIRGFQAVEATYVVMDDVITSIREYAQSLEDPNAGALIHDLATWLDGGLDTTGYGDEAPQVYPESALESPEVFGAEHDDVSEDVARVEIYPDPPEDPRPKWYARSIDTGGFILKTTNGSFDQEWVIQNAQERWPGIDVHLLKSAGEDSKWIEDATRGVFPSQGPPVRRLFAGAGR